MAWDFLGCAMSMVQALKRMRPKLSIGSSGQSKLDGKSSLINSYYPKIKIFHWIFPQFPVEIPQKSSEFSRNFQWKFAAFPLENLSKEAQ